MKFGELSIENQTARPCRICNKTMYRKDIRWGSDSAHHDCYMVEQDIRARGRAYQLLEYAMNKKDRLNVGHFVVMRIKDYIHHTSVETIRTRGGEQLTFR